MKIIKLFFGIFFLSLSTYAKTPLNFNTVDIKEIKKLIQSGDILCEQVISQYLDRIKLYNFSTQDNAPINAFTVLNTEAIAEAKELDNEFKATKKLHGKLHCIPVVVKDNTDTFDMTSTSGSLALLGNQPTHDAFIVARIRAEGGIIIAKTAMDEFANGLSGISSRSGRVGNSYSPEANPGGSSSGSGAAVSLNFALLAIGTDNSGSVRIPAAFNGIVGLRPSTGLISQRGIFPRGNMDGVAGPMAQTVEDLALLLDVIAKEDAKDPKTHNISRPNSYAVYLKDDALQGKRIGIVKSVGKYQVKTHQAKELLLALKDMQTILKQQGAIIVNDIELPKFNNDRKYNEAGELQDVNEYLASFPAVRKNYNDICESNRTRALGVSIVDCLKSLEHLAVRDSADYNKVLKMFEQNRIYVEKVMSKQHLDALIMPISKTGSATYDAKKVNTWQGAIASNAGLPAITMTIGYSNHHRLPIGIELIGRKFTEGDLISFAYSFQQHSQPRILPLVPKANEDIHKLSLSKINNLISDLGYRSYKEVLLTEQKKALTAERFQKIAKDVLSIN